uniref:Exonuclease domain-containing protein n=1 Tax=viral metagenome TaxID=1070528 RepID=A0A6C0DBC9_9ZZZZ
MKLLLIDTETNGLPANRFAPASCWEHYPAILQLSYLVYESEDSSLGKALVCRDISIALPEGVKWNPEAAAIHGIDEATARKGEKAADALTELYRVLRTVDCVCAHNLAFDRNIIRAAAYAEADRGNGPPELRTIWPRGITELCTMAATRELLCLPSAFASETKRFKAPRLGELYAWLYGHVYDISGSGQVLHTAQSDTHCLAQCVSELIRRGYLKWQDGAWITPVTPAMQVAASSSVSA